MISVALILSLAVKLCGFSFLTLFLPETFTIGRPKSWNSSICHFYASTWFLNSLINTSLSFLVKIIPSMTTHYSLTSIVTIFTDDHILLLLFLNTLPFSFQHCCMLHLTSNSCHWQDLLFVKTELMFETPSHIRRLFTMFHFTSWFWITNLFGHQKLGTIALWSLMLLYLKNCNYDLFQRSTL